MFQVERIHGHPANRLSSRSSIRAWSCVLSIRPTSLSVGLSLSRLGRPSARRTWIPAGTSSDCRYVSWGLPVAFLIDSAAFSVYINPLSDSIRRVARDAVEEVNKVFVLQLLSELKRVHRGDMATR